MQRILIYLIALIVLAAAAAYIYTHAPRIPDMGDTTAQGTQMTVQDINEDTDTYTINAKYAQYGIPSLDAKIKAAIDTAIAEFKTYPANPSDSAVPKNQFNADLGGSYIGPDVASVALQISEYTGGAHPNTIIDTINIDTRTGSELSLDDALALIGMDLPQVASSTLAQLKTKLDDVVFEEGAQPTKENYAFFLIDKDSVTFIFQSYQVAPYAAGIQEIAFPRVK